MFKRGARPQQRIAGWTIHPYGPKTRYGPIMDQAVRDTAKHGDTTLPFFITEYGISTNNGQCLDSNYNWPTCLTYQQAADDLHGVIADMHQTYGTRLAEFLVFEQRDMGTDGGSREDNFGALKSDGSQKGAVHERDPQRAEHLPRLTRAACSSVEEAPSGVSSTCWMRRTTVDR